MTERHHGLKFAHLLRDAMYKWERDPKDLRNSAEVTADAFADFHLAQSSEIKAERDRLRSPDTKDYPHELTAWAFPENFIPKLIESADILLHKLDYDGHGWEEHEYAYRAAKLYIEGLNVFYLKGKGDGDKGE